MNTSSNSSSPIRITAIVNGKNAVNLRSGQNKEWIHDIERIYNIKLSDNIAADIFFAQYSLAVNVLEEDSLSAQNEKYQLDRCAEVMQLVVSIYQYISTHIYIYAYSYFI